MNTYTFLNSNSSSELTLEAPSLPFAQLLLNQQRGIDAINYTLDSIEWKDKVGDRITDINNLFLKEPNLRSI